MSTALCILLAISFTATAAAAVEHAKIQSHQDFASNQPIEVDVQDKHVDGEFTEVASLLGTGYEALVRKTNGAQVSHEGDAPSARSLQVDSDCTFIATIDNLTVTDAVCALVEEFDNGDGDVSGETVIAGRPTCTKKDPNCKPKRRSLQYGDFNYPGVGYMVVTAKGINNCTALEAQLRGINGVTYVANDAYACTVNGRTKGPVSEEK